MICGQGDGKIDMSRMRQRKEDFDAITYYMREMKKIQYTEREKCIVLSKNTNNW